MYDAGYLLRKAYYDSLKGKVEYQASEIPVVDEKVDQRISEHNIYIKLFTQNEQQQNTKCYFASTAEVVVEIVHRTLSVGGKMVVDDIANQILQLLFPTRKTTSLLLSAPFRLSYARFERSDTTPLAATETGFIQVKTLTFSNRVIQPI